MDNVEESLMVVFVMRYDCLSYITGLDIRWVFSWKNTYLVSTTLVSGLHYIERNSSKLLCPLSERYFLGDLGIATTLSQ